ncbi:MAG TPA: hypothetical protein VK574_13435 [Terracidiphilus sp.]|nr:hypothetical protein [Terracidiphilus sp.]
MNRSSSIAFALLIVAAGSVRAQTGATLLAGSLKSLGSRVEGLSLSGAAEFMAGATDEAGSFTAQCALNGNSQVNLQLGEFSRAETRQTAAGTPSGSWTDEQGISHAMAGHNVITPASWFCPAVMISDIVNNPALSVKFVGQESKNGKSVDHVVVSALPIDSTSVQMWMASLSQTDIFLDSSSLLPVEIDFNVHPDNNAAVNIPVEIRFSNYVESAGVWQPATIEKYLNSTLTLALQTSSSTPSLASTN